ncbi:MAG: DUF2461 family protein [bacterium]
MKKTFFDTTFIRSLNRSYTVPFIFWNEDDEEFYNKNILPKFKRFVKDLLPKVKKCDSRVNSKLNEILVTCINRDDFVLPENEYCEIGAVIGHRKPMKGKPFAGLLFGFTPKKIVLAGGIFGLTGEKAAQLSEYLEKEDNRYKLLQENEDFADSFGVEGFSQIEDSFATTTKTIKVYKSFVGCTGEIPARFITDSILADIIIAHYKGIKAMNRVLTRALRPKEERVKISI